MMLRNVGALKGVFVANKRALLERKGVLDVVHEMLERFEAHLTARSQFMVLSQNLLFVQFCSLDPARFCCCFSLPTLTPTCQSTFLFYLTLCPLTSWSWLFWVKFGRSHLSDVKLTSLSFHETYTCKCLRLNLEIINLI